MRQKLIGLSIVVLVVALVWYVGAKIREHREHAPSAPDATHEREIADAAAAPELDAGTEIADADEEPDATLAMSAACLAMQTASKVWLDRAEDAGFCVQMSLGDLACSTSKNGATWGIRIDDVTDLEPDAAACPTGWLERVVHVAPDGSEQALVPPGPGGVRNGHRYNVYKAAPVYAVTFFDWNGDGEDEAVIGRWTSIFAYTFEHGRIVPYPPASKFTIAEVKDVDEDGRPDLLVRPFGDSPATIQLLAHSLPDGAFSLHDLAAVQHAQKLCPADPRVTRDVDEENLANDLTCALLWGHDARSLRKDLCESDAGPCPPWVTRMLATKPLLSLR